MHDRSFNEQMLEHLMPLAELEPFDLLDEREKTHGDFAKEAIFIQSMKFGMREQVGWDNLSSAQMESLDMIATKIGRVLNGDSTHHDHWADIAGYANLILRDLRSML